MGWVLALARGIASRAPAHQIGVIARLKGRLRFVDTAAMEVGLEIHRWEDGVVDTATARLPEATLSRITASELAATSNPLEYLTFTSGLATIQESDTRKALTDAPGRQWFEQGDWELVTSR